MQMSVCNCKTLLLCPSLSSFRFQSTTLSLTQRCFSSLQTAPSFQPQQPISEDTVKQLLTNHDGVSRLMKMERKPLLFQPQPHPHPRWFPYLDRYSCENGYVISSGEIIDAVSPVMSEERRERFKNVVWNRSYSVCLVVEGLCDFGNVSAAFRSADALGVQSVHVVSCDANKRCLRLIRIC